MEITGFEILEKAGEGGMAIVWKARQLSLDRIVAIKMLSSQLARDSEDVHMFQTEAQSAAKLKHPGIVQVYDANVENGMYYFVMEYVAGYTVGTWVRRSGKLKEENVLLIAECVADALQYAWEKEGMIHCDIKPDNVMIDDDGTVKITDLGLARTIFAMGEEAAEEVMGTPAYISPEQAIGEADLDFRADIYSLGAMMYHLLTGNLMFQGQPDDTVMELQVHSTVPDVMDVNPEVSQPMCWLLEKMLAKQKENRHGSWDEVKQDIKKVKEGHMPSGMAGDDFKSTMERSVNRNRKQVVSSSELSKKLSAAGTRHSRHKTTSPVLWIAGVAVITLGAVASIVILVKSNNQSKIMPLPDTTTTTSVGQTGADRQQAKENAAGEMFKFTMSWIDQHPKEFDNAINRMKRVADETKGTKFSLMALDEIEKLTGQRKLAVDAVMRNLDNESEYHVQSGEFDYAAGIYRNYAGEMASESSNERSRKADEIIAMKIAAEKARNLAAEISKRKYEEAINNICDLLLSSQTVEARLAAESACADKDLSEKQQEFKSISALISKALEVDAVILASFNQQIGQTITVQMKDGAKSITIKRVNNDKVEGSYMIGSSARSGITFSANDLAVREKLLRIGPDDDPVSALVKGQMAVAAKAYDHANKYFNQTDPVLGKHLVSYLAIKDARDADRNAEASLRNELRKLGLQVGDFNEDEWLAVLFSKKFSQAEAASAKRIAEAFRVSFGSTGFAKRAQRVLELLSANGNDPEESSEVEKPEPVIRKVRQPAGEQTDPDKVFATMARENPGFCSDYFSLKNDENGNVTSLSITFSSLKTVSPLKGLTHLKSLSIGNQWSSKQSFFSDLDGLEKLPLEDLRLYNLDVKDLGPVADSYLGRLEIYNTPVKSLFPLRNMQLEHLVLDNVPLRDIKEIRGMPLKTLVLRNIKATDFSLIGNMNLVTADFSHTSFRNMAMMRVTFLESLNLEDTSETRLTNLRGCTRLKSLNIANTMIRDISPLKGLALERLNISNTKIQDINPISEMELQDLAMRGVSVKDYSFLGRMPLKRLDISDTKIRDLEMLRNVSTLEELYVANNPVESIQSLSGLQLAVIDLSDTKVGDLTVLSSMPLSKLCCERIPGSLACITAHRTLTSVVVSLPLSSSDRNALQAMKNLRTVNGLSIADGFHVLNPKKY